MEADGIDAYYVATPPREHRPLALLCLQAGKPVLVEKPFAIDAAATEEIIDAARSSSVFCMEGMWTRFLPLVRELKRLVDEGAIGEIRAVTGSFGSATGPGVDRNLFDKDLGGGALLHSASTRCRWRATCWAYRSTSRVAQRSEKPGSTRTASSWRDTSTVAYRRRTRACELELAGVADIDRSRAEAVSSAYLHEYEQGCTYEHVGYHLTQLCSMFGPVESVTAFSKRTLPDKTAEPLDPPDTPDFSVGCLNFRSGVVARVTCSIAAPLDHRVRVIGNKGMLSVDTYRDYRCPVRYERFGKLPLNARKDGATRHAAAAAVRRRRETAGIAQQSGAGLNRPRRRGQADGASAPQALEAARGRPAGQDARYRRAGRRDRERPALLPSPGVATRPTSLALPLSSAWVSSHFSSLEPRADGHTAFGGSAQVLETIRIPSHRPAAAEKIGERPSVGWAMARNSQQRILAVSSSGGHWVQLSRLRPAFEGHDVAYLTTERGYRAEVAPARFYTVKDASRWNKLALAASALKVLYVVARERPDVVVSTGAAPGYLAVRFAKLIGAQTAWVDSIANVEEMSLSGQMASTKADLCLTQWPHLSGGRVGYRGTVL